MFIGLEKVDLEVVVSLQRTHKFGWGESASQTESAARDIHTQARVAVEDIQAVFRLRLVAMA